MRLEAIATRLVAFAKIFHGLLDYDARTAQYLWSQKASHDVSVPGAANRRTLLLTQEAASNALNRSLPVRDPWKLVEIYKGLETMFATRNKCIATSNKCLTSSNKKLLEALHSLGFKRTLG